MGRRAKAGKADLERLLKACERQGAQIDGGGNRHFKVRREGRAGMVVVHSSASDRRALMNTRKQLSSTLDLDV